MIYVYKYIAILLVLWIPVALESPSIKLSIASRMSLGNEWIGSEILFSVNDLNHDFALFSTSTKRLTRISNGTTKDVYVSYLNRDQSDPSDLFFDSTGAIWLISPEDKLELLWLNTGDLKANYVKTNDIIYKRRSNSRFDVGLYGNCFTGVACMKINRENKVVDFARFPKIFTNVGFIRNSPIAADNNSVYLGQYYSGVISRYDLNGMLIYAIPTIRSIEHLPTQSIKYSERKSLLRNTITTTYITRFSEATNAIIDVDVNSTLLITLFSGTTKDVGRYLDFYNKNTGQPIDSIDLDTITKNKVIALEVVGESMYLLSKDLRNRFFINEYTISLK